MAYFRFIIFTTSIATFCVILTTGPCCSSELTNSSKVNSMVRELERLEPNETNLPRPIVPAQVQPKRMKLKVTPKRRKHSNATSNTTKRSKHKRKSAMHNALQSAARKGMEAMIELFDRREPDMVKRGNILDPNDPGALLSKFSSSDDVPEDQAKGGYAALVAAKHLKESTNVEYVAIGRQVTPKISLKRTPLEGLCPARDPPPCVPASRRYRTHDGTCNNRKRPRWGAAQMPFHRFLAPEYTDGVEGIRRSANGSPLPSARFVSLVVHGARQEEAPITMMLALWGQLLDHDLTATAQPRSLNGSTPRCCGENDDSLHPSCLPIKVPLDDPWLSPLGVRCLEFLRSAPAQRRDCLLSWREQTNQVTSYIDASPIYSSNPRSSDNGRIFRGGMLLFGRGPPSEDVCFRAALANQCIRPGDARSGEQPGLMMLHVIWVNEHNQIANRLSDINPHWSDEKLYQEARRIVGAMFQQITYREFLPVILGKEVSRLFNLELETSGFYNGYDPSVNPTVSNEFSAAAFRFGHSLIQGSYMRADRHHRFIPNNVTLHDENAEGDLGGPGSLHRLIRGMVNQRALKRDEFITAELTNHLFQTSRFPFGLDLAAINIQRGRDHGIQPYVSWRIPCGLTPVKEWGDLDRVMGPASAHRLRKAYRSVDDIDLFVGGLAERPVIGGIVGPTFSCIIAQQFSNLRKGDRFWYENPGFESSFTPAQLDSIRQVAFSQVICRALGGGTLQPHVFLPHDNGPNERLPCSSKLMAPIDLEPWTERDPFARPNDTPNTGQSGNLIDLETAPTSSFSTTSTTTTTTTRRPTKIASVVNNVDFIPNANTGLHMQSTTTTTRRPTKVANVVNNVDFIPNANTGLHIPPNGQILLNLSKPATAVNNKLDLNNVSTRPASSASQNTATRPTPHKEPFLTASTAIDNKLDLTAATVPPKRKPTRKTTPKRRPTPSSNIANNIDLSLKRDLTHNLTEVNINVEHKLTRRDISFINLSKLFTNDDNATLLSTKNIELRRGYYQSPAPAPPSDYDDGNHYDYHNDADPPVYVKPGYGYGHGYKPPATEPPYPNPYYIAGGYYGTTEAPLVHPPYCVYNCYHPPMTTYNPYGMDTRRPLRRTTPRRGLPNKITNVDYDHDAQLRQTTKKQQQQQRTTTIRSVFQQPGLIVIKDNRPNDKPIFLSSSSFPSVSSMSTNVFPQNSNAHTTSASQSVFSVDPRPEFSSLPIAHQSISSPIFSQKNSNHNNLLGAFKNGQDRSSSKQIFALDHDNDYDSSMLDLERPLNIHEHDGYLRPELNKYKPLKKTNNFTTYRDYSLYNRDNTIVTYEIPTNLTLWTNVDHRRYAENHQQFGLPDLDDDRDQFVGPYIEHDKSHSSDPNDDQLNDYSNKHDIGRHSHETDVKIADEQQSNATINITQDNSNNFEKNSNSINSNNKDMDTIETDLQQTNSTDKITKTDKDIGKHGNVQQTMGTSLKTSKDQTAIIDSNAKIDDGTNDSNEHDKYLIEQLDEKQFSIINVNTSDLDSYDLVDLEANNYDTKKLNVLGGDREKPTSYIKRTNTHLTIPDHPLNRPKYYDIDPDSILDFEDTFARTSNQDTIQSILSDQPDATDNDHLLQTNEYQLTESEKLTEKDEQLHERKPSNIKLSDNEHQSTVPKQTNTATRHTNIDDQSTSVEENRGRRPIGNVQTKRLNNEQPTSTSTTPKNKKTSNASRKRRPTNPRRPTNNPNHQSNHGQNDRRQPEIALVPFVLLTSIDRPDNWVMFNVAKSKERRPLPDVPQLKSDIFSLSELPKPIFAEDGGL
ncbi:uncharacterized protein LOC129773887 [Toxorhynchites rutilus septentrionalis]|uniref:uncharacterized protein LOC129773887 n=1 Tax=Toxorhynchites rutilus septentrionalis TaxID=329112 RepID=UPI0024792055|nr:uncharacterized protein LOC129773887 [Toxorhynchites rutilus septentrionalis]